MNKSIIHNLSDELGAVWTGDGGVELYQNLDAYTPQRVTVLTEGEIAALLDLCGYCETYKTALGEALDFLLHADFDFRNGVVHNGADEGEYLGWNAHGRLIRQLRDALGLPHPDLAGFEPGEVEAMDELPF